MAKQNPQRKSCIHPNQFKLCHPPNSPLEVFPRYTMCSFLKWVMTSPWLPFEYIKDNFLKESEISLVMERKESQITFKQAGVVPESKPLHLPFIIQLHYWGKGSLEGHWPRKFSILLTHHQEGGRRKVFSLGIFLFVCIWFFGSWKGWQRTVTVQAVRIFL